MTFSKADVERIVAETISKLRIDISRYDAGRIGGRPVNGVKVKLTLGEKLITDSLMVVPWEGLQ